MATEPGRDFDLTRLHEIADPLALQPPDPPGEPSMSLPAQVYPTRTELRRRRWVALSASLAWIGGQIAVLGLRTDWHFVPAWYLAINVLVPLALALVAVSLGLRSGRCGLGPPLALIIALVVFAPLLLWTLALVVPPPYVPPSGLLLRGPALLICLGVTVAWALVPLVFATMALRRTFAAAARWRSALIGAACGLLAGATMGMHCPEAHPLHLVFSHGLPVLLTAVLGAVIIGRASRC